MVEQPIGVSVQIAGEDIPAGRLWTHRRGRGESATFAYLPEFLARQDAYALDPSLPLQAGNQYTAVGQASLARSPTAPRMAGDGVWSSEPSSTRPARTSGLRVVSPRSTTYLGCATIYARDRRDSRRRTNAPDRRPSGAGCAPLRPPARRTSAMSAR